MQPQQGLQEGGRPRSASCAAGRPGAGSLPRMTLPRGQGSPSGPLPRPGCQVTGGLGSGRLAGGQLGRESSREGTGPAGPDQGPAPSAQAQPSAHTRRGHRRFTHAGWDLTVPGRGQVLREHRCARWGEGTGGCQWLRPGDGAEPPRNGSFWKGSLDGGAPRGSFRQALEAEVSGRLADAACVCGEGGAGLRQSLCAPGPPSQGP